MEHPDAGLWWYPSRCACSNKYDSIDDGVYVLFLWIGMVVVVINPGCCNDEEETNVHHHRHCPQAMPRKKINAYRNRMEPEGTFDNNNRVVCGDNTRRLSVSSNFIPLYRWQRPVSFFRNEDKRMNFHWLLNYRYFTFIRLEARKEGRNDKISCFSEWHAHSHSLTTTSLSLPLANVADGRSGSKISLLFYSHAKK
jgi:hypothetical protein